jgi:hypothetical protein
MTLEQAVNLIKDCAGRMTSSYGKVVFDEWVLVSLQDAKGKILAYIGPRKEEVHKTFVNDLGALRSELIHGQHAVGEFEFARHGVGTSFEAFLVVGQKLYLVCNNTALSMEQIVSDSKWLQAQSYLPELAASFRNNPLTL